MASNPIIKIKCENLAPIKNLFAEIKPKNLRIGIYANNGSGKTYISRAFRLLENNYEFKPDSLIRFNETKCNFQFSVNDSDRNETEDINLTIYRRNPLSVPKTNYIYHTFNRDYIEENVLKTSFEKNGENIVEYIIGKGEIDIENETKELKSLKKEEFDLQEKIKQNVTDQVKAEVDIFPYIRNFNEYKTYLNYDSLVKSTAKQFEMDVDYETAVKNLNSIRSLPENLEDINEIGDINISFSLKELDEILNKELELSLIAKDFKEKIKSKQNFIEQGLVLIINNKCPFCEQNLDYGALKIIDQYNDFIRDTEAKTIKMLNTYLAKLEQLWKEITIIENEINSVIIKFNDYVSKYIPSMKGYKIVPINNQFRTNIGISLKNIIETIKKKIENIGISYNTSTESLSSFIEELNKLVIENNKTIKLLNFQKANIGNEIKEAKRTICKASFNKLLSVNNADINLLHKVEHSIKIKEIEIKEKQEKVKIEKRPLVGETIKKIPDYFFSGKYKFDIETFRLTLDQYSLDQNNLKDVLSEGEKSIIAFAYYIGDTHLKVETISEYNKIFFIIDDPISSLDFNYVYSVCGVIRDIKDIFEHIENEKFIILSHNTEFMRILSSNEMFSMKLILKNDKIKEAKFDFSNPYIDHLLDIYRIAQGKSERTHTTANSIRHVLETIVRFENCETKPQMKEFLKANFDQNASAYTLIQDLSHGALRYEQKAITDDQFSEICKAIIEVISRKYRGQVDYIEKFENRRV